MPYAFFCTRGGILAEIRCAAEAPHGPEGPLYPGTCRNLSRDERQARVNSGAVYALRLDTAKAAARTGAPRFEELGNGPSGERGTIIVDPLLFGDVVLARKDTPTS